MKISGSKTKVMAQVLSRLVGDATVLILIPQKNAEYEMVMQSANNLPEAKTLLAGYLNISDLLGYDKVVIPLEALDAVANHLG
jgi:large subunit ribosomal protein L4